MGLQFSLLHWLLISYQYSILVAPTSILANTGNTGQALVAASILAVCSRLFFPSILALAGLASINILANSVLAVLSTSGEAYPPCSILAASGGVSTLRGYIQALV